MAGPRTESEAITSVARLHDGWNLADVYGVPSDWSFLLATLPWYGVRLSPLDYRSWVARLPEDLKPQDLPRFLHSFPDRFRLPKGEWWNESIKVRHFLNEEGALSLTPMNPDYPPALLSLTRPPLLITLLGSPLWSDHPLMAVVGSRRPTLESLDWLDTCLGTFLKRTQGRVVSGGARGIDQKAHLVSLRLDRPTLCVLPSGLGRVYPPELRAWRGEFLRTGGALVSTYPPFCEMRKWHFVERNEILAALSLFVLVVEARRRSGSLVTARAALDQGKVVAALPWSPLGLHGQGCLDLLVAGAQLVRDEEDLMALMHLLAGSSHY